jgi:glutathione S-transferase
MKIHLFPLSGRVVGIVALKNYLAVDCKLKQIDLGRGDQHAPEYVSLNPNRKIPTLEDDGIVLWESNAILFYMASKRPESGVWPSDLESQAHVLRWLFWESAHWDAESCGMVAYEKGSKDVLGLGPPDPAFIARGEQNFSRFAAVLNDSLKGKTWVLGNRLTLADFSIGGLLPTAQRLELRVGRLPEICRWYEGLASLPAWREALAAREAALASWASKRAAR